ncbi:MAG: ABC transporter ATP-binding protein [Saprospiraceae bacterium]|nr:ABC transporter ATP-binding protein [Lewinella sp.]
MSEPIIKVDQLGKKYFIGHKAESNAIPGGFPTLRDQITGAVNRVKNGTVAALRGEKLSKVSREEFWALKDVSFDIQAGEVLGIIGRNGAGKSTLLKLLSRITTPSTGQIILNGRVASLLEVGTGFHPELTGRENIYLNGAVLGMRRTEIKKKFDEIVAFSEVERFLDTPVKRYSSGMYVRLAFSVAAHLEPDILVVDEVLAVGDAAFQKKCLGKMGDVATQEGRTVLLVSHNMLAVKNLCKRAIWMENGQMKADGAAAKVVSGYLQSSVVDFRARIWDEWRTAPGNDQVRIHRLQVSAVGSTPDSPITMQTPLVIEVEFWNLQPEAHLHITLHLITEDSITAFTTGSDDRTLPRGLYRSVCHIPGNLLNQGNYEVKLLIIKDLSRLIYIHEEALSFEVLDMREQEYGFFEKEDGVVAPLLDWHTECVKQKI